MRQLIVFKALAEESLETCLTSYGWKAPIAGRPPGCAHSPSDTTRHSRALLPPFGPWRNGFYPNDLPDFSGDRAGNWRQRHSTGKSGTVGRRYCPDERLWWLVPIAAPPPDTHPLTREHSPGVSVIAGRWTWHKSFFPCALSEIDVLGSANWCGRQLPSNPWLGGRRHSQNLRQQERPSVHLHALRAWALPSVSRVTYSWSFLPKLARRKDGRGRPWRENRAVLNGILWILRTGVPSADLPDRYPSYQTCHRRFQP
jgi:hypothetical protein